MTAKHDQVEFTLNSMINSSSWKITASLRFISIVLSKIFSTVNEKTHKIKLRVKNKITRFKLQISKYHWLLIILRCIFHVLLINRKNRKHSYYINSSLKSISSPIDKELNNLPIRARLIFNDLERAIDFQKGNMN